MTVAEAKEVADFLNLNSSSICFDEMSFRATTASEEYFEWVFFHFSYENFKLL